MCKDVSKGQTSLHNSQLQRRRELLSTSPEAACVAGPVSNVQSTCVESFVSAAQLRVYSGLLPWSQHPFVSRAIAIVLGAQADGLCHASLSAWTRFALVVP